MEDLIIAAAVQHRRSDADSVIHTAVEAVDFHIGATQIFIFFGNVFVQKQVSLTELQSLIFGVMGGSYED